MVDPPPSREVTSQQEKMGLFNRKSKVDAASVASKDSRTTANPQSPPPSKTTNGISAFPSISTPKIAIPPPPDPARDPAAYLRSIHAVRERSRLVHEKAKRNNLTHFDVDPTKFGETAAYIVSIIKVREHREPLARDCRPQLILW